MALGLIASYFVAQTGSAAATAVTTPSFTPSNGEVIVVKLETWDTGTSMGAPTGGSQTYTSRVTLAPGGFRPWIGLYTAVISGSPGAMTISSTPSASARFSMTVERWSGAQLAATPVTASANGSTGAATASLAPTGGATSVISWVAGDSQSLDPSTRAYLGSGADEGVRDDHVGSNGTGYHGWQASTGTGSQAFGLSAPTGMQFGIAGIEVQASGSVAPAFPSSTVTRRVLRGMRPRRGQAFAPVPSQVIPQAPAPALRAVRTRVRGLFARRARSAVPTPNQVTPVAPLFTPPTAHARVKGLLRRLGRQVAAPAVQLPVPAAPHGRPRMVAPRRSRVASPVSPQIVAAPPAYPPPASRPRLKGVRLARGRSSMPTPPQVVLIAPKTVPVAARIRAKLAGIFRGQSVTPVPAVCDCTTHRPNSGITLRPGTGSTARPAAGTTTRPCSCQD
jgi:hypothetical protein